MLLIKMAIGIREGAPEYRGTLTPTLGSRLADRYEAHGRPLHRFRDRFSIAEVVLVSLEERLDVLRRDQTHIVTKSCQLSCDKMRA